MNKQLRGFKVDSGISYVCIWYEEKELLQYLEKEGYLFDTITKIEELTNIEQCYYTVTFNSEKIIVKDAIRYFYGVDLDHPIMS